MELRRFVAHNADTGDSVGIFHALRMVEDCSDFDGEDANAMYETELALDKELPVPPYDRWNYARSTAWFTEEGVAFFGDKLSVLAYMVDEYLSWCGYSSKVLVAEDDYSGDDVLYRDKWQVIVRCA